MFFRRQEGEYRETDRVTRFKLIKSGKHWLRASTSQFGLFKVLRGGVDAAQVTTEVIEEQSANTLTGLDILKGIAAAGTVLGGGLATTTHVYAEETTQALEKEVNTADALATVGSAVLGNKSELGSESVITNSQSDSHEVSLSASVSESIHVSETASKSLKESESAKASLETSLSASKAISESGLGSGNVIASILGNALASQAPVNGSVASKTSLSTAAEESVASLKEVDETAQTSQASQVSTSATGNASELSLVIENSLNSLATIDTKLSSLTVSSTALRDTTITAAVATTATAENDKKAQEDRKRLSKISATMGEYLAKSIGLPNTNEAVAKVNAAVTAIEEALKTPNADLTDVIKQATSAQNSIINAVLRANNGQRSALNGKAMERGSSFREAPENNPNNAKYGFSTATVGYVVTKADAGDQTGPAGPNARYGYREGTYLYATEGRQGNGRAPQKANIATRVEVREIASQVYMKAVRTGTTTRWEVLFNDGGQPHDNPFFYFTVPKGHRITNMKVEQKFGGNGAWQTLGEGTGDNAFRNNSKSGDFLPAIGNAQNNQGGSYYENVAGVGPSGVGRGSLTSLRDFAFNNPEAFYQTDQITERVKKEGDFAFGSIEDATANVYALHPKGSARYEGYRITYTTESPENTKDYYMAGFRSLENSRHRNYLQMVGTQDRYRIELKPGKASTFYKWGGVNNIGNLSGIADVYDKVTGQKVQEIPNGVTFKVDGTDVNSTVLNWLGNTRGAERGYGYLKFSKGNHKLTVKIPGDGGGTYELPFRVITQSDVYQPTINTNVLNQSISKGSSVPSAASMISGFTNSSSTIPNLTNPDDLQEYKDALNGGPGGGDVIPPRTVSGTATSASNLNVASVEWLGGGTTFGSGVGENMAVKATVNGQTVYLPLPSDMPASKLGKTLSAAERTKVLEHNGFTASTATITSGKVGLSKSLVVTYKDNEGGDSRDISEVFFENVATAARPTVPEIQTPSDGSVTVTPKGESDSITISYNPTSSTTTTSISLKKSGNTWDNSEPLPSGVTLDKSTGAVTISEPTVKDESQVTATAYNFNSEGATSTGTAQTPYRTRSDRFYAVQGENVDQLSASDFITNSSGGSVPSNVTVTWKTKPDFSSVGDKNAVLTVTNSGISKDFNYNYTVYKKIDTITKNGVTGQFYAFKDDGGGKTSGGDWANNIGGHTQLYTNSNELPSNTKWSYEYKLNSTLAGTGTLQKTAIGTPNFSEVWNNNTAHRTEYRVVATYPNGRFGTVSSTNPALTSQTSFTYTVVDPVAKQTYETTVGNMAPLSAIKTTPGQAVTNATNTPTVPTGTDFAWETPISDSDISTPGFVTKKVRVTLPKGSANQTDTGRNSKLVPVTIKVNPQTPQIAADQVTNTGGLPNRSITVTNVTPGATVTLTIGSQTIKKQVGNGETSVTFTPPVNPASPNKNNGEIDYNAFTNGLLPTGTISVKQEKEVSNPSGGTTTLTSATTTASVTKETERPNVEVVLQVKDANNNWVVRPKEAVRNSADDEERRSGQGYELYAGDEYRFVIKTTDNSGKVRTVEVWDGGSSLQTNITDTNHSSGGTITNITGTPTTATTANPATLTIEGKYNETQRYEAGKIWTRQIRTKDLSENSNNDTSFIVVQGKLSKKFPGRQPDDAVPVANPNSLTDGERTNILNAVKTANPETTNRISNYTIANNGIVTITYKDGTTSTVQPKVKYGVEKVSDRFYVVGGEDLSNLNLKTFVRGIGNQPLPERTTVAWKTGSEPSSRTVGNYTAKLVVTHPDSQQQPDEIDYNYTVYPKIETKTANNVTGKFFAFKGTHSSSGALGGNDSKLANGQWANNYGKGTFVYTNGSSLPTGTKWYYTYRLNNTGEEKTSSVGRPDFGTVWYTTKEVSQEEPRSHKTTYTITAIYPTGRFGAVTTDADALKSNVEFEYTVIDPQGKEYVTTVGNTAPIAGIVNNPGEAVQNSDSSVAIPNGPEDATRTTYSWVSALNAAEMVSSPGIYKKIVRVTLPKGAQERANSYSDVPVTIKVKPKTPQIADDQVTKTGGLPKGITVTDVTPGATVTLTLGSKTIPKEVPAGATSITFGADELADSNGLLPVGEVTVKQSKDVTNPTTNRPETLESATTTKTITKETEGPNVTVKVEVYNPKTDTWVEAPKYSDGKSKIFAGDKFRVMVVTTDNSGKVKNIEVWNDNNGNGNPTTTSLLGSDVHSGGSAVPGGTGGDFPATADNPQNRQVITDAVYNLNKQYRPDGDGSKASDNEWTRYVRVKDFSENETRVSYGIRQAPLSEKYDPAIPDTIQVTNKTNPSPEDQRRIREAVSTKNAGLPISRIDVAADGSVTVVYTDGTREPLKVELSNEQYSTSLSTSVVSSTSVSTSVITSRSTSESVITSRSTSESVVTSRSTSESASTSFSASASSSQSLSESQSASESASQSASESASTSASQSASESASESASTSASTSASQSASESASTSASTSASQSASESASTSASTSASQSASESASTSASTSASISASISASNSVVTSTGVPEIVKPLPSLDIDSIIKSDSISMSVSTSASTSASILASTSASTSASVSASMSASAYASTSTDASDTMSTSGSVSTSMSTSTDASDTMSTSTSASTSTSGSTNSRPQETRTKASQDLPNTGEKQSVKSGLLGLILGLTGLGLVAKRRKKDDED